MRLLFQQTLSKQLTKLNRNLKVILAYSAININDVVVNGDPNKLGVVCDKEIQNDLPVVWVDWDGVKMSSVPVVLTVIPKEQLEWQWIDGIFTREYDYKPCKDIKALLEEARRLKTKLGVLSSPEAIEGINALFKAIANLWEEAIEYFFPINSGFFLHNRKVVVKAHQLSKQHDLLFPVVFDGKTNHLAHPLELKKIPLGQLNMFREDNTDPDEPDEESNEEKEKSNEDRRPDGESVTNSIEQKDGTQLTIDSEFKSLIPPLDPDEKSKLEQSLIAEGCRDSLIIWKNHNILIDGHNRYELCIKHNISYKIVELELQNRDSVINWMINNQLARRNLKPEIAAYLRGKLYRNLKKQHGGDRKSTGYKSNCQNVSLIENQKSNCQNVSLIENQKSNCQNVSLTKNPITSLNSAETVAKKTGVKERTIYRDAKYSEAVEAIAQKIGLSPQDIINSHLSKQQIKNMVNMPIESIKQKLENPQFIESSDLPDLKVGDIVQIKSGAEGNRKAGRTNKDLVGYNKSYAIVDKVYDTSADIQVWQQLITGVHKQFLVLIEEEKITLPVTLDKEQLKDLMLNYNSIEDTIIPF